MRGKKIGFIIIIIVCLIIIVLLCKKKNLNVYISSNPRDNNYVFSTTSYTKTSVNINNIYDNRFIANKQEANNLISEYADNQRLNCHNNSSIIKEIENNLNINYGIVSVNLCELSDDYARNIENVFSFLYQEFPTLPQYLTNVSLANIDDNIISSFKFHQLFASNNDSVNYPVVYKVSLLLNSKFVLNMNYLQKTVRVSSSSGYFPQNATEISPVVHEVGHYLSFAIQAHEYGIKDVSYFKNYEDMILYQSFYQDRLQQKTSKLYIEEAMKNYNDKYNYHYDSINSFRNSISKYAAKDNNYDETIAEAFHDYYLNGNGAKLESLEIINILKYHLEVLDYE